MWDLENRGKWTRRLIPRIGTWVNRKHGTVNFYLTQLLTGRGCFNSYLHKIGKMPIGKCSYCEQVDDAEQTFFSRQNWSSQREELAEKLGVASNAENLIILIIESRKNWSKVCTYTEKVLKQKREVPELRTPSI